MPAKKKVAAKKLKFTRVMYLSASNGCMVLTDARPIRDEYGAVSSYKQKGNFYFDMCGDDAKAFGFDVSGKAVKKISITVTEI